jgi:L-fucose isomerase
MRNEQVDMSGLVRRFDEKIYSDSEFRTALEWVKKNCKEGPDINAPDKNTAASARTRPGPPASRWP